MRSFVTVARKASFSKRSQRGGEERELKFCSSEGFNIKKTNVDVLVDGLVNLSPRR